MMIKEDNMNANIRKKMYSEVYSIINLMSEEYKKRLPSQLYELIKKERLETYNPVFNPKINLVEQNISREAVAMLVLLQLNYWCDSEEEKQEINKMLKENSTKVQKRMREMYSSENIFKNINAARNSGKIEEQVVETEEIQNLDEREKGLFKKTLQKINNILHKEK